MVLGCAVFALLYPGVAPATSSLAITLRAGYPVLQDSLRQALGGGQALNGRYESSLAGGHATVRLLYRADLPKLTVARRGAAELQLDVPVTVSRLGRDGRFIRLDDVAKLGYRVNGCTALELVARTAVTLALRDGVLRLSQSASPPTGRIRRGGCSVQKKPAADVAKALGNVAGAVLGAIGGLFGDSKLSETGRALKRQVDALPARVAVDGLVRDAADAAVREAVGRALASQQDRLLDRLLRARISHGLERSLSAGGGVVSLDLKPAGVVIEEGAFEPTGLAVTARAALRPQLGFAGAGAGADRNPEAVPGFTLPFEFVLPVRALPEPPDGSEWMVPLADADQSLGLASVPGDDGLARLRLHRGGTAPVTIIYLSAVSGSGEASPVSAAPGGPQGDLDPLLGDMAGWLDSGGGFPIDARASAQALGGRVEAFRSWIALIVARLARLELGERASLRVTDPRIEIFPGRYCDGLIRLPVHLVGQARLDVDL